MHKFQIITSKDAMFQLSVVKMDKLFLNPFTRYPKLTASFTTLSTLYKYSEASVIAVNGDRDHKRKLKIREVAAPL